MAPGGANRTTKLRPDRFDAKQRGVGKRSAIFAILRKLWDTWPINWYRISANNSISKIEEDGIFNR